MKSKKQKKNRFTDYPKYKLVIPFIICIYDNVYVCARHK